MNTVKKCKLVRQLAKRNNSTLAFFSNRFAAKRKCEDPAIMILGYLKNLRTAWIVGLLTAGGAICISLLAHSLAGSQEQLSWFTLVIMGGSLCLLTRFFFAPISNPKKFRLNREAVAFLEAIDLVEANFYDSAGAAKNPILKSFYYCHCEGNFWRNAVFTGGAPDCEVVLATEGYLRKFAGEVKKLEPIGWRKEEVKKLRVLLDSQFHLLTALVPISIPAVGMLFE